MTNDFDIGPDFLWGHYGSTMFYIGRWTRKGEVLAIDDHGKSCYMTVIGYEPDGTRILRATSWLERHEKWRILKRLWRIVTK